MEVDESGHLVKIRIRHSDHPRVAHRAPHDLAQHVAATLIGGQHAVVDQKRGGAGVIGVDAERSIDLGIGAELHLKQVGRLHDDGVDQVGFVIGELALQNGCYALKAHAAAPHMAAYGAKTKEMIASRVIHILSPT